MYLKKTACIAAGLILLGLASCSLFDRDRDSLTAPAGTTDARPENFILGDPEISGWGGYYHANNTFFALNVPVSGALQVTYRITTGAAFALFLETPAATKMEIGLQTVNGVTDVLDSVCVTYAAGVNVFANVPAGAAKAQQHKATHYQRQNVTGGAENWWPIDAAFGFGVPDAQVKTVCVARNGALSVTEISGAFPKAAPVTTTTTSTTTTTTTTTTTIDYTPAACAAAGSMISNICPTTSPCDTTINNLSFSGFCGSVSGGVSSSATCSPGGNSGYCCRCD